VDKKTAQQSEVQQFETDCLQGLGFIKFSAKILRPCDSSGSSKQELHDLVDKLMAQQPKVQQFESTWFQDPLAAAETSGNYPVSNYHTQEESN
jgi:hypothetical protein